MTSKDIIVSDFKKMNKNLMPSINEWFKENQPIDTRAAIYFFSSLIKEMLTDLEGEEFEHFDKFKESVIFFILEAE